ncbi:radial spoke head protein 9 homolog isoform X2 [Canis lupus familiaris]|uniref:radial spoke head protein 9 homolog isoform X2 n=1 Tax=Canis lupus familiaris TaxID=9615 RepID=UPI0018F5B5D5|nr:radial spoke head protein 9 homolog isoform X2 [Canis lupus familiaris]XP_038541721.1 radial spoke head protein 9 homolog isoform X2 [Canis lupus familiaris]
MDSESLLLSLELASGSGQGLSPDRRASLLTSLTLVKRDYRYSRVLFWGRILGLVADYYIAQGLSEDQLAPRKTLYSLNCMEWSLLPPATEEMAVETSVVKGRFMGDPSHEYEHTELQKMKEGEKVFEEEVVVQIKEENRLVSVINQIDKAVAVIPRGALFKTPFGPIHVNRTFEGLSLSEAKKLSSYFHFREPVELKNKTLLEKADLDPSLDFMDSLEHDIPKATLQGGYCYHPHFTGSWSIQMERGNALVVLRSLLWPGLTFFHAPRTKNYGYIYMGTGEKNIDLPFML